MTATQPYRSVLFMPGSNARALEKAKNLPADALVFDLEDAVAPDAKAEARELASKALASDEYGKKTLMLRINGVDTDWWQEDVLAAARAGATALVIPKVEDPNTLIDVKTAFISAGGDEAVALWAMIETPLGVLRANEIAAEGENLTGLIFGANDLAKELHAKHVPGREPLMMALSQMLLTARAHGLIALDSVYNDFRDNDGFEAECLQARNMGFDGKTLIHPNQIDVANIAFAPSPEDVAGAERLVAAFDEAAAQGKGVAVLNGKMIEELHVVEARRLLALAQSVAER